MGVPVPVTLKGAVYALVVVYLVPHCYSQWGFLKTEQFTNTTNGSYYDLIYPIKFNGGYGRTHFTAAEVHVNEVSSFRITPFNNDNDTKVRLYFNGSNSIAYKAFWIAIGY